MESGYFERALIQLKRKYGKDELVRSLMKELSNKDKVIGQLKAEIDHLEEELKLRKEEKLINREAKIQVKAEENYQRIKERNKKLSKRVKQLIIVRNDLLGKLNAKN